MLFAMKSHSLETSSGGNSIWSVETDPGCVSTSTFMNALTVAALDERRKILSANHAKIHGEESQVHDAKNWWQGTAAACAPQRTTKRRCAASEVTVYRIE